MKDVEQLKIAFNDSTGISVYYYKCNKCGETFVSTPFNLEGGQYSCKCHKPAPVVKSPEQTNDDTKTLPDVWLWYVVTRESDGREVCLYRTNHKGETTIVAGAMPYRTTAYHTTLLTNCSASILISETIERIGVMETKQQTNKSKGRRLDDREREILKGRAMNMVDNDISISEIAKRLDIHRNTVNSLLSD